jgi:hypothetical protein
MLYDIFICHASADKTDFVRPLAEALRNQHVEVWYDEMSLKLGDSIRRTIDEGLRKSRFGLVVLSKNFFARNWPQYELDALADREMAGKDKVLLPIWHGVTHQDVLEHSPALAGRMAVKSSDGMQKVVKEILSITHPQESPLIVARNHLLEWDVSPPVITDEYWLDVVEASNRVPGFGASIPEESSWERWSFPLPPRGGNSQARGERLAWTAMQLNWVRTAESAPITPLTPVADVLSFIESHPGLFETCTIYPELLAEYAPQLTIKGFGGELESEIETAFRESPEGEEWTLRRDDFANDPVKAAYSYFHGGMFGPTVSPYTGVDHLFWLLSSKSKWLPTNIRTALLEGMKNHPVWLWPANGAFSEALFAAKGLKFTWNADIEADVRTKMQETSALLGLPENEDQLLDRFKVATIPECYLRIMKERSRKQRQSKKR